jgi:hypothetical protein
MYESEQALGKKSPKLITIKLFDFLENMHE